MRPEPSILDHCQMFLYGFGAAIGGGVARLIIANINTGTDHTKAIQDGLMFFLQPIFTGVLLIGIGFILLSLALAAWDYFVYFRDQ